MRLLQIRFKNLNSLAGEWKIDLTHPAFVSDGIFAITGPTGAGKTTILDAICLALYGRTPRLDKVSKGGNEIMSRRTGDCFAEVTFETQIGSYRCHWSQHRARKKPDGELQNPKHEIADAGSGRILEAKMRGVADQIEATTGMDFDRFTRSMLLAQGGFATFLKAAPDERAPILEQITGTEIYSRISVRVHERRSEERNKLDALQKEMDGIELLTAEDEQQLGMSLEQKNQEDVELNQQMAWKNQAIAWIESIARLEEELKNLGQQKNNLQARMEAFAPEQEKLRLANQALELAGDYSMLTAIRQAQETDGRSLGECRKTLPGCEEAAKLAETAMNMAAAQLEVKKGEQQQALPVIRKARELDLRIAEKDAPIRLTNESIAEFTTSLEALRTKQNDECAELETKHQALEDLLRLLEATKADEGLVEHLTGIRERFEALLNLHGQLVGKLGEIDRANSQLQEASRAWQEQSGNLDKQKQVLYGIQVTLAEKQAELQKVLENKELAHWRNSQSLLAAQKELLAKALETVQSLLKSRQAVDELDNRKEDLDHSESTLTIQLNSQTEKQVALEKETELLDTQVTLLKKIEDLEEARHQLQDGEPCPLCGALEHPFAKGNVPVPDETRERLATVRSDLKAVMDGISNLKVKLAQVSKDFDHAASSQKEHGGKITEANRLIIDLCSQLPPDLGLITSDPDLEARLNGLRDQNHRALEHVSQTIQAAEGIEKELNTLRNSLDSAKELVANAGRETQDTAHKQDWAAQLLERLKKEAEGLENQREKSLGNLQKDVQNFGVEALSIANLDRILAQLASRREQWIARQKEKTDLDQKIVALTIQTRNQAEQIQKSENEIKKQQDQLEGLLREQESFARERQELFQDKKPDDEETHLSTAIESADQELDAARQRSATASQELSQLKSRIAELVKAIETRDIQLKSSQEVFQARLKESGFTDEEHYRSACLPENQRRDLAEQSRKLSDENTELTFKEREKTKLLETERQKQITEESLDELKNAWTILVVKQKELQREIGGIRQKLHDNELLKQKQQAKAQAIDAQKRECSRWDSLDKLIGSADGKRYRNFAQGLTFEIMIGHANRQLQKMTDRYLLVREHDRDKPLELNVIDNYQAGEVRSTKNLSGGESFIVSLALALGLSHMASKNVRVDSLFLDEGFGTLDDEALDTALETLASLQQDGKLIGVISHVPSLKERIGTRIEVIPQTGGRSLISGPGCERFMDKTHA